MGSVDRFFFSFPAIILSPTLVLAILPDDLINIFSTEDTLPPPKVFGLMEKLFVRHHAVAARASHIEHLKKPHPYENGFTYTADSGILPNQQFLSIQKLRL